MNQDKAQPLLGTVALAPLQRVDDLARLQARLAEPFAEANWIFKLTGTTVEVLEAAQRHWLPKLAAESALATAYAEAFTQERSLIRDAFTEMPGADETVLPAPRALARPAAEPTSTVQPRPALPFVEGQYAPPPVPPSVPGFDAGATALPAPFIHDATLPFLVHPLKKPSK